MRSFFMCNIFIALSFFLISCSNITDPTDINAASAIAVQATPNNTPLDATPVENTDVPAPNRRGNPSKPHVGIFREILMKLELTVEQKPIVERLLSEYTRCTNECMFALKTAEREIMINARMEAEKIKKDLEAGLITNKEAREKRAQLKKSVDTQLKNLPIRQNIRECIKSCDATFIKNLESILNPTQIEMLKKWVETKQKHGR